MKKLLQRHARTISSIIIFLLFITSLWQLATAGWIQSKAIVAQQLLDYSWRESLRDKNAHHKPWPWSDSWPVAKLIVPQHNVEQIILAGDSGSNLAFAPGYSLASSLPNSQGISMVSAHRDTHFSFLKNMEIGEIFYLQTTQQTTAYRVDDLQIVDSKTYTLQTDADEKILLLVTCYPFDAISTGGSLRYLVFARQTTKTKII